MFTKFGLKHTERIQVYGLVSDRAIALSMAGY